MGSACKLLHKNKINKLGQRQASVHKFELAYKFIYLMVKIKFSTKNLVLTGGVLIPPPPHNAQTSAIIGLTANYIPKISLQLA